MFTEIPIPEVGTITGDGPVTSDADEVVGGSVYHRRNHTGRSMADLDPSFVLITPVARPVAEEVGKTADKTHGNP